MLEPLGLGFKVFIPKLFGVQILRYFMVYKELRNAHCLNKGPKSKLTLEGVYVLNEPRCEKTGLRGFRPGSDTNRAVQPQKMARGLKFWI